jgi:hypothetical protein
MPKLATAGRSFGRFRRAASAIRLACLIALVASLALGGSVRAEDGCPAGRYPSLEGDGRCVPPADHNLLPVDDRKPMRFQMLEVARGAFLQGTGTITAETPAALRAFLTTKDAQFSKQLYLHSPGGSIEAAMELGEVIRGAGLNTNIGRTISIKNETSSSELHTYKKAECRGACAYAFLGGVYRTYGGDLSRRSGIVELYGLKRGGGSKRPLSASETERLTSRLAASLERMGVPQELLSVAASAPEGGVLSLPEEKAKALRVIVEPSRRTMFRVELWGGRPALRFNLPLYDMALEGIWRWRA